MLGFNLKLPSKLGICSSSKELASVPEIVPVKPNPLLDVSAEPLTAVSVAKFLPAGAAWVVLGIVILDILLAVGAVFVILTVKVSLPTTPLFWVAPVSYTHLTLPTILRV